VLADTTFYYDTTVFLVEQPSVQKKVAFKTVYDTPATVKANAEGEPVIPIAAKTLSIRTLHQPISTLCRHKVKGSKVY
jgi:hypothetical protein